MSGVGGRSLSSPAVARRLLASRGIRPNRFKGQNFLIDANVLEKIRAAARLSRDDTVIEVGAGLGALTELLVARCGEVLALESDVRLAEILEEELGDEANLRLVRADASRFDFAGLFAGAPPDGVKMVSNLPYSIAATLVIDCLKTCPWIRLFVVMVQSEVAERLMAAPGSRDYSAASVRVQCRATVKRVAGVSRNSFYPRPKVDSTILRIERLADSDLPGGGPADEEFLDRLLSAAFGQRRKKLTNAVSADPAIGLPQEILAASLITVGAGVSARAESLTPEQFVLLSNRLVRLEGSR